MRGATDRFRAATRGVRVAAAALALLVLAAGSAVAQDGPREAPAIGAEAAELDALTARVANELRCPVCRNQSVLESSSRLARDMQSVIRQRLAAGESPEAVKAYFVARYGEWILLKPEPRGLNLAVYLLPAAVLLAGGLFLRSRLRAWREGGRDEPADGGPRAASGSVPEAGVEGWSEDDRDGLSEDDREWLNRAIREG